MPRKVVVFGTPWTTRDTALGIRVYSCLGSFNLLILQAGPVESRVEGIVFEFSELQKTDIALRQHEDFLKDL